MDVRGDFRVGLLLAAVGSTAVEAESLFHIFESALLLPLKACFNPTLVSAALLDNEKPAFLSEPILSLSACSCWDFRGVRMLLPWFGGALCFF
jgi:hypothetical protein